MRTGRLTIGACVAMVAILAGAATQATAASISPSEYALQNIVGSYHYGQTDWVDDILPGPVDNVADLGVVEGLMSDGYVVLAPAVGPPYNGIYNFPSAGLHALEFAMNSGQDYTLSALSFISTRSYDGTTPIRVEVALDGGAWAVAAATTPDALGMVTGPDTLYTIALGDVQADAFRFVTEDGNQVSLHEIIVDGEIYTPGGPGGVIPEPLTVVAVLGAMGGLGGYLRKRRVA